MEGRARKYAQQVNPDEYNRDYLDAFLTARADQLRRSLDLQLANKTLYHSGAGGRPGRPGPSDTDRPWPQAQQELARCREELARLRQLDGSPL